MRASDLPPTYGAMTSLGTSLEVPPLPQGVPLIKVYADFIRYLYAKTRAFFVESTPNGQNVWNRLKQKSILVLCTPNGWVVSHQVFLRNAIVRAGIMGEKATADRVEFIAEGEASVHYVIAHTKSNAWLKQNMIFGVIDAGGSTIDSTLYECKDLQPLRLEEVCASECVQVTIALTTTGFPILIWENLCRLEEFSWTGPQDVYLKTNCEILPTMTMNTSTS
jgi:hypothetical protein